MSVSRIASDLAEALSSAELPREDMWKFIGRLQEQLDRTSTLIFRRMLQIISVWAISLGIVSRVIRAGAVAGFSLSDVSPVLVFAPVLVALLFHDESAALALQDVITHLIHVCHQHLHPKLSTRGEQLLNTTSDFLQQEDLLILYGRGRLARLLLPTSVVSIFLLFIVPIAALTHLIVVVTALASVPVWLKITISVSSALVAVRGILTWVTLTLGGRTA